MKMSGFNFEDFMDTSSLWTLIFLLAFVSCSPLKGEFTLIGPSQPIAAVPGDDVILPCQLDPALNLERFAVEWSNPDLKPDPSDPQGWVDVVFLYRHRQEDLDMKLKSYINRTELFTEELKHGNISLKILNVTPGDAGRYKCFIPKLNAHSIVELVVDADLKDRTAEMPPYSGDLTPDLTEDEEVDQSSNIHWILPVVFLLLVLAIIIGYVMMLRRQKQTHKQKHDVECDAECDVVLNTLPPATSAAPSEPTRPVGVRQ